MNSRIAPTPARRGRLAAGPRAAARRVLATLAAHEHRTAAGLFALLVLAYLWPVLLGGRVLSPVADLYADAPWIGRGPRDLAHFINFQLDDVTTSYYPWEVLARRMLHAGTFPAWNPHALAGTPFFANVELAWLSPFSLPLWILPLNWALGFAAALKLWVAGFGAYLLVRELRLGFWPGMLAGVCFALCAFDVVWLAHGVQVSVAALLPWMLWLAERLARRGRAADALALAAVVAVAMANGHPGTQVHVLSATVLYALMRTAAQRGLARRERARRLGLVGGALALGVLALAVVLLPAELAARGTAGAFARARGSVEFLGADMPFGIVRTALFPDWWGRPSEQILNGPASYNERTLYAGTVALLLALVALGLRGGWRRKGPFLALGLVGLAVAIRAPLVHALVANLPLFDRVQNQRMLLWSELAIAVLGAFGLQAVLERARRWQAGAALALGALAAVLAAATLTLGSGEASAALRHVLDRRHDVSEGALALASICWWAIFTLALAAVLALAWARPRAPRLVGALVVLVAALDMLHFARGYQPMPPSAIVPPAPAPAIRFLQRHADEGRMAALRVTMLGDVATIYGLRDVRGYDQPQPSLRQYQMWHVRESEQTPGGPLLVNHSSPQLLGMLGMRYLLASRDEAPPGEGALKPVYRGRDAFVYRNPFALPRATVVPQLAAAADTGQEIATVTDPAFDPRQVAVVRAADLAGLGPLEGGAGRVRVVAESNARVALHASLARGGLVLLDDAWAPGWSVRVDGRPARVLHADVVLRGVAVPAGEHEVVWSYRVPGLRAGLLLSALALLAFAACGGVLLRRRRYEIAPTAASTITSVPSSRR